MILHENCLLADISHEISYLICYLGKSGKICNRLLLQIIGGALRVKHPSCAHLKFNAKGLNIAAKIQGRT